MRHDIIRKKRKWGKMSEMELDDRIRQRIKQCREGEKLTLEDVGKVTGVTAATVNRWESGDIKA